MLININFNTLPLCCVVCFFVMTSLAVHGRQMSCTSGRAAASDATTPGGCTAGGDHLALAPPHLHRKCPAGAAVGAGEGRRHMETVAVAGTQTP